MIKLLRKAEPHDVIAIVFGIGAFGLIAAGVNSITHVVLIAIVSFYFGRKSERLTEPQERKEGV